MNNKITEMTTYRDGEEVYKTTEPEYIYKWLAETYIWRHQGSKNIKRIIYHERYDGYIHATYYISNGTRVEVTIPRS